MLVKLKICSPKYLNVFAISVDGPPFWNGPPFFEISGSITAIDCHMLSRRILLIFSFYFVAIKTIVEMSAI
jgi:hypothetical protein